MCGLTANTLYPFSLNLLYARLQPVSRFSETPTTAIFFCARKPCTRLSNVDIIYSSRRMISIIYSTQANNRNLVIFGLESGLQMSFLNSPQINLQKKQRLR